MLCLDQCLQKFINKTLQGGKRLLFNSDPWPPAEQKLEMPCDIQKSEMIKKYFFPSISLICTDESSLKVVLSCHSQGWKRLLWSTFQL